MANYQIIIPARGGSKRFPRKNIALLNNIPLIAHSINFGMENNIKANVFVNSDDDEILNISKKFGANVVKRPPELATDTTPTVEVLKYQIEYFEKNNIPCDAVILLQATNPIRPRGIIEDAVRIFESNATKSLVSYSLLNKKFGTIKQNRFIPSNYLPGQRMQDIEKYYFENGLIYITDIKSIKLGKIITDDAYPYIVDDLCANIDIDEPNDLVLAEAVINILRKQ